MVGRRRGARTGRGWDAKPSAPARSARPGDDGTGSPEGEGPGEDASPRAERAARRQAQRDPHELAREICLRQLSVRPRTRAELAAAMRAKDVADEVAEAVLDRYDEVGMIDDAAFARAWVSSRHHGKGLASRALGQELRRRGVDQEVVTEALAELDDETQAQTAYELAVRKLRTTRGEPDAVFRRVVGALARKGYPGGVAVRAVKDALAARSAEDAELAELLDPDLFDTPEQ